jgi:hypothetical protein
MPDELELEVQFELKLDIIEDYDTMVQQQQRANQGHGAIIALHVKVQHATVNQIKNKVCVFNLSNTNHIY